MYFWNYRLSKAWLDHSLKSVVSEHPSTVNTLNGPKHLRNVYESTFVISFHHSVGKWFAKYLSYRNLGSHGCLLTLWVLITSMPFRIVRICGSLFKCNYLKNENFSLYFLFHWSNLKHFFKKEVRHSWYLSKITDCQTLALTTLQKVPFQKIHWQSTCQRVPNTCEICMSALLSYFSISLRANDLENISLIEVLNHKGVC